MVTVPIFHEDKEPNVNRNDIDRRDFFKTTAAAGAGAGFLTAGATQAQAETAAPLPQVPKRKLGASGIEIPMLLVGGGKGFDAKYDKRLHRALSAGANYVDTASHYARGQSHTATAAFIKQVGREKLWVTSKSSYHGSRATPEKFRHGLEQCFETLETDYLDMYFMHALGPTDVHLLGKDLIDMAEDLKKQGKIKLFGFSCHLGNVPELLEKAAALGGGIDAIMLRYNFRDYGDLELNKALDAAHKAGIGLIAMKTQGSVPDDHEQVVEFQSKDLSLGQAKLKAVWADERITAICSNLASVEQVEENVAAACSPVQLSMAEYHQLNRFAAATAPHYCRGCSHKCESKVDGEVRIADTLRYLMYDECYGDHDDARRLYAALEDMERGFNHLDLTAAQEACPQGIDIARRLAYAKRRLSV